MAFTSNTTFVTEFLDLYKSMPELWKAKSKIYKNHPLKQQSYAILLQKYREIDKNADMDAMKKKINCLRASYRRELNKIYKSEKSGCETGEVYTPTLWYFQQMSFLKEDEEQLVGISTENVQDCSVLIEEIPKKKRQKTIQTEMRIDLMTKAAKILEDYNNDEDEESSYSSTWEHLFRKLSSDQKLFANKLIMDILFRGALGKLSENTEIKQPCRQMHESPPSSSDAYNPLDFDNQIKQEEYIL